MDKSKIPKGMYCYSRGGCPYRENTPHMYVSFGGCKCGVVKCNYLGVNTMQMILDGDRWSAWLLQDSCKPCGANVSGNEDDGY